MSARRPARPLDRRGLFVGVVLSLLVPGLGHAWASRLLRALVWFGGTIAVTVVLRQGPDDTGLAIVMAGLLAIGSALDLVLLAWLDRRTRAAR